MDDGSILNAQGEVVAFSAAQFIRDIVEGDRCFICGVSPEEAPFNQEHILPQWILKKYNLYSRKIGLPNDADLTYGRYTLPCCQQCNARMSEVFETPLSRLVADGYEAVRQNLLNEGPLRWFTWLTLIFVKAHLKDKELYFYRDRRLGDERIAGQYAWEELHHLHCVGRSFATGAALESDVIGSLLLLPARTENPFGDFDYADLSRAQTMLLRLGEVAFVAVLNDACAALNVIQPLLQRIDGPLSPVQFRELLARMAAINLNLTQRPIFSSRVDRQGHYTITAEHPAQVALKESHDRDMGEIMAAKCQEFLDLLPQEQRQAIEQHLKAGDWTFLTRPDGSFARNAL